MDREITRYKIIEALKNIYVFIEDYVDDVDLDTYIEDSIQFMSFVVAIEEAFNIEFPAEMLVFDNFKSIETIVVVIEEYLKIK